MKTLTTISILFKSTVHQELSYLKPSQTTRKYSTPGAKSIKSQIASSLEWKKIFEALIEIKTSNIVVWIESAEFDSRYTQ